MEKISICGKPVTGIETQDKARCSEIGRKGWVRGSKKTIMFCVSIEMDAATRVRRCNGHAGNVELDAGEIDWSI